MIIFYLKNIIKNLGMDNPAWYYNSMIVYDQNTNPEDHYINLSCCQYGLGWIYERIDENYFLHILKEHGLDQSKLLTKEKRNYWSLHVDSNHGDLTGIFYLNSNDGYTHFNVW